MIIKIVITGYFILFGAILANILADYANICTWYKFLQKCLLTGLHETLTSQNIISLIWLFVLYPIILSLSYIAGIKLYDFLIQ